jgi:hypothetical protein
MCKALFLNHRWKKTLGVVVLALLVAGIGSPAAKAVEDNELVDRWEINLGGIFLGSSTDITLYSNVLGQGTTISLEDDLGFESSPTSIHINAAYLIGRRHQVSVGYFQLPRDTTHQISFDLEWGDETFPVDATVTGYFDTTFLEFGYDFWLVTKERTALSIGLSLTWASLEAGLGVEGVDGSVGADLNSSVPVPTLAVKLRQHLVHRLNLNVGLGYMTLSPLPDYSGNVWRSYIGLEHRTWDHVGFGLKYGYDGYDITKEDGSILDWDLALDVSAFEAYLHFMF